MLRDWKKLKSALCLASLVATIAIATVSLAGKGGQGGGKPGGNGDDPNANYAFAYTADGILHLTTIDGTQTRDLSNAPGFCPTWSPDLDPQTAGYQGVIAYWQGPRNNGESGVNKYLYVINPDGTGNRLVRSFRWEDNPYLVPDSWLTGKHQFAWSPNGREIVYSTWDALYAVDVSNGSLRLLLAHPGFNSPGGAANTMESPTISPLNMLAFGFYGDIYVIDFWLDENGLMQIDEDAVLINVTNDDGAVFDFHPVWSPDGTRLAFRRDDDAPGSAAELVVYDLITDEFDVVFNPPGFSWNIVPTWSPDGSEIALRWFTQYDRKGQPIWNIYRIVDWDDPANRRLIVVADTDRVNEVHPAWNPAHSKP